MKDSYFKYEKYFIAFGLCAIAFLIVGCQEPKLKKDLFKVEAKDVVYTCNSNGFWYKKTGSTKVQIVRDGDKYLTCGDERL